MPEKHSLLLIGGGGHCKSVIDTLRSSCHYDRIGIAEKRIAGENLNYRIEGIPIIGFDDELETLKKQGYEAAFITVGSVGNPALRKKLFERIKDAGFIIPNIIDKTSIISGNIKMGTGIFIGKGVIINTNSMLGDGVIINSGSIVEHECNIGNFVHVSPGSVLCGNVTVGDEAHIGAGSITKQGICIGDGTIIGMGSVVLHDIGPYKTAYGNPCREVCNG